MKQRPNWKEQQALIHYADIKKLTSLTTKVDNLNVHELKTIPPGLRKLSNVLDNVVKTSAYDKLVW